jgi:hypothetical protein
VVASLNGPTDQLKVGRDGFFAFWAFAPGLDAAQGLAGVEVEVHDGADELVLGELAVLGETDELSAGGQTAGDSTAAGSDGEGTNSGGEREVELTEAGCDR